MDYRYFYISTSKGHITVWKFDSSKRQIHVFNGHFKSVTSMAPLKDSKDQFASSSLDGTLRIWSLDKFQQLYVLQLDSFLTNFVRVYQHGERVMMGVEGAEIVINKVHLIVKNYLAADSEIAQLLPGFN